MKENATRWWMGPRGEWYVVVQILLFLLILFGPETLPGWPRWPWLEYRVSASLGWGLLAAGSLVSFLAASHLGSNLTPLPHPKAGASLVVTGVYRFVRHPIYFGVLLMAIGFSLLRAGPLTMLWTIVLGVFFDIKSRREERWLCDHFPEYRTYQKRVRKLIPFLY